MDVRAAVRLPQRLRLDPRGRRAGDVPDRAARRRRPGQPPLPARHDDPRDQLGHPDRLDHRPRRAADRAVAPRPATARRPTAGRPTTTRPSTSCSAPSAASPARCRRSWTASRSSTTAARPASWEYTGDELPPGRRDRRRRRDVRLTLTTDMLLGFEGGHAGCAHAAQGGRRPVRRAVVGRRRAADDVRRRLRAAGLDRPPLAALAGPRAVPRPPLAQLPPAQRADPQGPDLRPDRRGHRGRQHVAARDPGRQPQLRLPLRLDPRRDVRAVGDVLPRARLGGGRLLLVHRRHGRRRPGPPDHVRHRRRAGARRVRARPSARLRQLPAGADRQRGVLPAPARRLGRPARLGLPALEGGRPPRQPDLADPRHARSARRSSTGASRTPASGRCAASRSTSRRRRSCAGSRSTAAPSSPG